MSHRYAALTGPLLGALALVASTSSAGAQGLDVTPAYHPNGPDAGYAEVFAGDPFTIELELPGLDHAASQGVASGWLTFLLAAVSTVPTPLTLAPGQHLWLNPSTLLVVTAPPSLELSAEIPLGSQTGITVQFQTAAIDLSGATGFAPELSPVLELAIAAPPTRWGDEMVPVGASAPGTTNVTFNAASNEYVLAFAGDSDSVEYVIDLDDPHVSKGTIAVLERLSGIWVVREGGLSYSQGQGQATYSAPQVEGLGTHTLLSHQIVSRNAVEMRWRSELPKLGGGTAVHERLYRYELSGRSLEIHAEVLGGPGGAADRFYAFTLGSAAVSGALPANFNAVQIPYMDQIGVTTIAGTWFTSSFVDLFRSGATAHTPAKLALAGGLARNTELMLYRMLDDGTMPAIDETGWVTLTRDVRDVFVETTAPASPYAAQLAERVGVTFARETNAPNLYLDERLAVERMALLGMSDVFLFKFHWTHFGTNRRATTHWPPNPAGGAQQQFLDMIQAARDADWIVALYTDFYSLDQALMFDDNPRYSETRGSHINWEDAVRDELGQFRKGYSIATFLD